MRLTARWPLASGALPTYLNTSTPSRGGVPRDESLDKRRQAGRQDAMRLRAALPHGCHVAYGFKSIKGGSTLRRWFIVCLPQVVMTSPHQPLDARSLYPMHLPGGGESLGNREVLFHNWGRGLPDTQHGPAVYGSAGEHCMMHCGRCGRCGLLQLQQTLGTLLGGQSALSDANHRPPLAPPLLGPVRLGGVGATAEKHDAGGRGGG